MWLRTQDDPQLLWHHFSLSPAYSSQMDDAIRSVDSLTYSLGCGSCSYDLRFHCSVLGNTGRNLYMFHSATSTERGHWVQKFSCLVFGLAMLAAHTIVVASSIRKAVSTVGCVCWIDRGVEGSNHSVVSYSFSTFLTGISGKPVEKLVRTTVLGTEDQTRNLPNTKIAKMWG